MLAATISATASSSMLEFSKTWKVETRSKGPWEGRYEAAAERAMVATPRVARLNFKLGLAFIASGRIAIGVVSSARNGEDSAKPLSLIEA